MKKEIKKMSSYKSYDDWVVAVFKDNKKQANHFLETALEDFSKEQDLPSLLLALRQVAKAQGGISKLSKKTKYGRESIYKILSKSGNPTISTFCNIINALGYEMILKSRHC
jgi:probable addiction module antidote protein